MKIVVKQKRNGARKISLEKTICVLYSGLSSTAVREFPTLSPQRWARHVLDSFVGDVRGRFFHDYGESPAITEEAVARGARLESPYDLMLAYDILDHVADPIALLKRMKEEAAPGGTAFLRCHPWCAKDACHLSDSCYNKAYLHMLFSASERDYFAMYGKASHEETADPLPTYQDWFDSTGWQIVYEEPIVENFPKDTAHWNHYSMLFGKPMDMTQFVDYILKPK